MVIRSATDLERLLRVTTTRRRRIGESRFTVSIPGLSEDQRLGAERTLNTYARACGCTYGGAAALATFAAAIVYAAITFDHRTWWQMILVLLSAMVFVALSAGAGKLVGVFVARVRFRRECIRLIQLVPADSRSELALERRER